jgi:hypothetical protein
MKKCFAIVLLSIFMCANTSIGQLLKFPNLIEHYVDHKKVSGSNSILFIDYLVLHYSKNVENNLDHQDLPFKTFDTSTCSLFVFTNFNYQISVVKSWVSTQKIFLYSESFQSNLIDSIWLPPKIL